MKNKISFFSRIMYPINLVLNLLKWRKTKRKGKTLRLGVANVRSFLESLNENDIDYLVLRWFDEVPENMAVERVFKEDIDFLIDANQLKKIVKLAALHRGKVKCDFYSPSGKFATGFKKFPYYPPALGRRILDSKKLYKNYFNVPSDKFYFVSLAYHLTYHKGPLSGLPTGTHIESAKNAKRNYPALIEELADNLGITLKKPFSLLQLHHYLESEGCSMPYDLMLRWPVNKEWIQYLINVEEKKYTASAEKYPDLVLFLLRNDAVTNEEMVQTSVDLIAKKFDILEIKKLSHQEVDRVVSTIRGGNWLEHRNSEFVPPAISILCNDANPVPLTSDDPLFRKYPLVTNKNVLFKHKIRDIINEKFPSEQKRIVIHGSDNALEAQDHIRAVYGGLLDAEFFDGHLVEK